MESHARKTVSYAIERNNKGIERRNFELQHTDSPQNTKKKRKIFQWCGKCCKRKKNKLKNNETSKNSGKKRKWRNIFKLCKKKRKETNNSRVSVQHISSYNTVTSEEGMPSTSKKLEGMSHPRLGLYGENGILNRTLSSDYINSDKRMHRLTDLTKSCCYLCVENSKAIAANMGLTSNLSEKSFHISNDSREMIDRSCSPMKIQFYSKTIKSSVKVKVCDVATIYPEPRAKKKSKSKMKRFRMKVMSKLKRNKRSAKQTVACGTEEPTSEEPTPEEPTPEEPTSEEPTPEEVEQPSTPLTSSPPILITVCKTKRRKRRDSCCRNK